jgi:DNA-binding response OmpR family regulator
MLKMNISIKTVLIVDDELPLLTALSEKFVRENFNVLQAKNGEEGLALAFKNHPDIILLDLVMPVMDGLEMLDHLRQDKWGKDAKVIILTNLSDNEKVAEALKKGSYNYLVKTDWKLEEIVEMVNIVLRKK